MIKNLITNSFMEIIIKDFVYIILIVEKIDTNMLYRMLNQWKLELNKMNRIYNKFIILK